MAFIPHIARATGLGNEATFYGVRLLLGAAEAGFFPGIIFYLTLWYPSVYRGRIIGAFMAIPLSSAIGSPISGMFLACTGFGAWKAGSGCSSSRRHRQSCSPSSRISISLTGPPMHDLARAGGAHMADRATGRRAAAA